VCVFKGKPALAAHVEGTKHLPLGTLAVVSAIGTLRFVGSTARGTALWLISKAFRLEKLLFPGAESECSPTIGTLDRLALKTHWMASSLLNFG